MENKDTISRLCYHAGLEQTGETSIPSLSEVLWRKESISVSFEDILDTLQKLNWEVNGACPSESLTWDTHFSRRLVNAMHTLIRSLRRAGEKEQLEFFAWKLEVAWSAILSGDIDDIRQNIAEEEIARGR